MKFGLREICDVVLKAKNETTIGSSKFTPGMPVLYFDSLKTSSLEGAATTVYAQGGRGNARLIAWEGDRTLTFTMEDALISQMGLAMLAGANLMEGGSDKKTLTVHVTETLTGKVTTKTLTFTAGKTPATGVDAYAFIMKDGKLAGMPHKVEWAEKVGTVSDLTEEDGDVQVFVDYYVANEKTSSSLITIEPQVFSGYYYLEASTLFRDENGVDRPAEFIIPKCKIQSNFTFTMAPTGDPSTFTFTLDAFPDYTKFDKTKKVLSAIQVLAEDQE